MSSENYSEKKSPGIVNAGLDGYRRSVSEPVFIVKQVPAAGNYFEFILSSDGVVKAWKLPKDPSMDPLEKRLAIPVILPESDKKTAVYNEWENIKDGTEILWDKGTFVFKDLDPADSNGKRIRKGEVSGRMSFLLFGSRLKGEFSLRQIRYGEDEAWMLVKKKENAGARNPYEANSTFTSEISKGADINITHEKTAKSARKKLIITNPGKLFWPEEGISKSDLIKYYKSVSEYILPYVKNRAQLLVRHPDGIGQKGFYQKDIKNDLPDWIRTVEFNSEKSNRTTRYFVCTGLTSLLYMVNLGCIEINPWTSRITDPEKPDYMIIDLDPGPYIDFKEVRETAVTINSVLREADIVSFPKTSGSAGIHIYIPLKAKYNYRISRNFAHVLVKIINQILPDSTSLERDPDLRKDKIYLDYLQNKFAQTMAAPYSVRPVKGARVSAPLSWNEMKNDFDPGDFTMKNILGRIKRKGDLFKGALGEGVNIIKCIQNLEAFYKLS